jgi:integrase
MPSGTEKPAAATTPRLLDQVRDRIRVRHYSIRTEQAYLDWIRRFIRFHGKRHPSTMGASEVELFLTDLAVVHDVSASTQNQAQSALLFLYKDVLGDELPWLDGVERAKKPVRLPVVLTKQEVWSVLRGLHGTHALIGRLLYGTGMRILEALRLRIKDIEFERRAIVVRDSKGGKDRITVLPGSLMTPLKQQLRRAHSAHQADLRQGLAMCACRMHSPASIPRRSANGRGNMHFPRRRARAIPAAAAFAAITSATRRFNGR